MTGLNDLEKMLLIASHDSQKSGMQKELAERPLADLAKLKSLIANVLKAGYDGDINPNYPIGPGMQAELTSALQKLNSFVKGI